MRYVYLALYLSVSLAGSLRAAEPAFPLKEGDRVVLIGDALIERAQKYGFLETELLARYPRTQVTFRNLGWNADTVRGLSRGYFDGPDAAEKRQTEQVAGEKPTVLIVGYGMSESFDGTEHLNEFRRGLEQLLDRIAGESTRVVLLSPIAHEDLGPPLPDPSEHNQVLESVTEVVESVAEARSAGFVNLFARMRSPERPNFHYRLTDNGIHLSELGYRQMALEIIWGLKLPAQQIRTTIDTATSKTRSQLTQLKILESSPTGLKFEQTDARLPTPAVSGESLELLWANLRRTQRSGRPEDRMLSPHPYETAIHLQVTGLKTANYDLLCDGQKIMNTSSGELSKGVRLTDSPQHRQAEKLRQLVIRKNRLFFFKYRPQNITYLLGFRRYEQGQNAKELEELAQLVAQLETEINAARIPETHTFEIRPAAK